MKDTKLVFKKRKVNPRIYLNLEDVKKVVDAKDVKTAWSFFEGMTQRAVDYTHDKESLEIIINWVPEGGRSVMETARWIQIAIMVNGLKGDKEESLQFTGDMLELIYARLRDTNFKLTSVSLSFYEFLNDLEIATGESIYKPADKSDKDIPEDK